MADAHISSQENHPTGGALEKVFSDEEVAAIEIYNIYNYTHDDGLAAWENIFSSLRNGITKQGMLQLISLACHIQNGEGEPLMKGKSNNHRTQTLTDGTYLIRARTKISQQVQEPTVLNQDEEDAERKFSAVCYFAACLMRLATNTPDRFMRGLSKIREQYCILYHKCSAYINSIQFERSMAEHISQAFRKFPVFKHTIVHHVAIAHAEHSNNQEVMGLLYFACVLRLQFHGMTVYPQYAALINRLRLLSPWQYLTWLRCPRNNAALNMLYHITVNYAYLREGKTPSVFWKYARIFDGGYFKALELETCKYLLATQTYLSIRHCFVSDADTPLCIGVIKNDSELLSSAKQMADEFNKAYDNLKVHLGKAGLIHRLLSGITDEEAGEYVRTHDLLSVHFEENRPLWKSMNSSKAKFNEEQLMTKEPRIQEDLSNSSTEDRLGTEKFAAGDMEMDEELFQRMKAGHLKKKTLSLGGPSASPEVSAGGSSDGATPDGSAAGGSAVSSKRTSSPPLASTGGSAGAPVVAVDVGVGIVEAEVIVEEVAPPLKEVAHPIPYYYHLLNQMIYMFPLHASAILHNSG